MALTHKRSPLGWIVEIAAILGLIVHGLFLLGMWPQIPASIPVHFDLLGNPDAWGGKADLLWLFGLSVLGFIALTWVSRYPHRLNYPWQITDQNRERQYRLAQLFLKALKCELAWLALLITVQTVRVAMGTADGLGAFFVLSVMLMLGITVVGYLIIASRSRSTRSRERP